MDTNSHDPVHTRVCTPDDGCTVVEQAAGSIVLVSADQILAVIDELRACYDYCAAWKEPTQDQDGAAPT